MSARLLSTVLIAWLLAGTLDIATAILYYIGASPARAARLLQGIASGLLGDRAFAGGGTTVLLGLALHYLIALIWTLTLLVGFKMAAALRRHLVLTGIGYGVVVWFVMNLVVLPLSNVRHAPIQVRPAVTGAIILILCIGLPISLVVGRHLRGPSTA
jgi:hypothetical protein